MMNKKNRLLLTLFTGLFLISCNPSSQNVSEGKNPNESQGEKRIEVVSFDEAKTFYSWTADRIPMVSAHRGGPYSGFPENSLEAFQNVINHTPSIIELDVAITKDSILVLMHDNTLDRTTTGKGKVSDFTYEEIKSLNLVDLDGEETGFLVPTFAEALEWSKGRALLTVDVKREVPFEMIIEEIKKQKAEPYAAVISYSVEAAKKLHKLHPDIMLSVTIRNEEELKRFEESGIPTDRWIAFTGTSERTQEFNEMLHERGVFTILGVLGNLDRSAISRGDQIYAEFVQKGADILATDRPIEAAKAIKELIPEESSKMKYFK
ncbi:glycerophosphodiester phosphodiesterase family protein [Belliella sp. R4-6]|uniref:Glycerophosphodiester phosphodiesterase family protein n=1 Tax=Belliella alkalica TaxID=1730871 RepID=A0ABS9VBE1_9BACT|nr:glycerophosphodiester phosphodiesterase family protein [Belliella alkalica]MCH7413749.1 glycerophosphodiester phosphodiesterase family protein [Belliella alkalica]